MIIIVLIPIKFKKNKAKKNLKKRTKKKEILRRLLYNRLSILNLLRRLFNNRRRKSLLYVTYNDSSR